MTEYRLVYISQGATVTVDGRELPLFGVLSEGQLFQVEGPAPLLVSFEYLVSA